jgi:hypothetical protein
MNPVPVSLALFDALSSKLSFLYVNPTVIADDPALTFGSRVLLQPERTCDQWGRIYIVDHYGVQTVGGRARLE